MMKLAVFALVLISIYGISMISAEDQPSTVDTEKTTTVKDEATPTHALPSKFISQYCQRARFIDRKVRDL
jgi:hypothetical protein